jgi:acetyl esterase/lipase
MDNMRPLAAALTAASIATWNVEYRRIGNAGGGWPGTFRDVAGAADHLRTLAAEHQLDLTRVVAIGHSAGGHLAMWLAARPKLAKGSELFAENPLRLRGAVDLDGPGDLKATIPLLQSICGAPVITDLLGGTPETHPARYRDGSPMDLLPFGVPQAFFAGQMFASTVESYAQAAKRAGDQLQTAVFPKAGHFVFIDPQSDVWPQVMQSVKRLLGMSQ